MYAIGVIGIRVVLFIIITIIVIICVSISCYMIVHNQICMIHVAHSRRITIQGVQWNLACPSLKVCQANNHFVLVWIV